MSATPGITEGTSLLSHIQPYVRHCGDSWRPPWRIAKRRLLDYMIVSVLEGEGRFERAGVTCDVGPGDIFWVPPDTDHEMEGFSPLMRCTYIHFDLQYDPTRSHWDFSIPGGMTDLSAFAPLMHPRLDMPEWSLPPILRFPNNERITGIMLNICETAERAQPFHQLSLTGLLWEMLSEILRGKNAPAMALDSHIPLLEQAAAYMRDHLCEQVSEKEIAGICGVCPSYFRKLFSALYGCSPRDYQKRARIQKAKVLMSGTSHSLSEVARQVGFSSVQNFSRAFHLAEGISPSDYRRCGHSMVTAVEGRETPWPR